MCYTEIFPFLVHVIFRKRLMWPTELTIGHESVDSVGISVCNEITNKTMTEHYAGNKAKGIVKTVWQCPSWFTWER